MVFYHFHCAATVLYCWPQSSYNRGWVSCSMTPFKGAERVNQITSEQILCLNWIQCKSVLGEDSYCGLNGTSGILQTHVLSFSFSCSCCFHCAPAAGPHFDSSQKGACRQCWRQKRVTVGRIIDCCHFLSQIKSLEQTKSWSVVHQKHWFHTKLQTLSCFLWRDKILNLVSVCRWSWAVRCGTCTATEVRLCRNSWDNTVGQNV